MSDAGSLAKDDETLSGYVSDSRPEGARVDHDRVNPLSMFLVDQCVAPQKRGGVEVHRRAVDSR